MTKIQNPKHDQDIEKRTYHCFGHWILEFVICL